MGFATVRAYRPGSSGLIMELGPFLSPEKGPGSMIGDEGGRSRQSQWRVLTRRVAVAPARASPATSRPVSA